MKTLILRGAALAFALTGAGMLTACDNSGGQGAAEKLGQDIDSAKEEAVDGQKDLTDGSAENLGEKIDAAGADAAKSVDKAADAAGKELDKAGDAIDKAAADAKEKTDGH